MGKFADDAGNTAQEFYTNRTVVTLMAEILQPKPNESIYDPTCGSGGMLVKCLDYLRLKGQPWQGVKVFGQEINALTSAIARMNLYLNGVEDFSIVREDTLAHPAFVDGGHLRKFDIVLANPPYSIKTWNREAFMNDKWGRNFLGTPPQGRADYAFFQHILASMDDETGRCAILFPHGVLFRDEEQEIRTKLIKIDLVECVIGLGPNLFYNSPMEACIIICRTKKSEELRGKILFINAVKEVIRKNGESYLTDEHIEKIRDAYWKRIDVKEFCKLVDNQVVLHKKSSLSIPLYVSQKTIQNNSLMTVDDSFQNWKSCSGDLHNSLSNFVNQIYG